MVYNYKRKTDRGSWSEENLAKAMKEAKKTSVFKASKMYGIPYATLHSHVKSGSSKKKLGRFETVFTPEEEKDIVNYVKKMDILCYGLTRIEFMKIAGEFAKIKGKSNVFHGNKAGKGWFNNFKRRHPLLALRSSEPTSKAREKEFNPEAVNRFYSLLEEVVEKDEISPDMIKNHIEIINQYDIAGLFTAAYLKGATPSNAISEFRASGIYPFNRHIISDEHFAPSDVYQTNAANTTSANKNDENSSLNENEKITELNKNVVITQPGKASNMNVLENIRPIPVEVKNKNTRGRKQERSEILTSPPIKIAQKLKQDASAAKRKVTFDGPGPSKTKKTKLTKPKPNSNIEKQQESYFCTVCKEAYVVPPIQDWIQCGDCALWSHEACSSYSGQGSYFCDDCFD